MSAETGILLALIDGAWTAPCGCAFHYWDGKPMDLGPCDEPGHHYCGVVAPQLHPCAVHGDSFYRLPPA